MTDAVSRNPDATTAELFRQAFAMHQRGLIEDALRIYEAVIARNPAHWDALHLSGVIHAKLNRRPAAISAIEKAIAINPLAPAYNSLGLVHQEAGDFENASRNFQRAISRSPAYPAAHFNLGKLFGDHGRLADAVASYSECARLTPADADVFNNRGNVLARMGRFPEAFVDFERATSLAPEYVDAYINHGNALAASGRAEEAIRLYDFAIRLSPANPLAFNNRGNALRAAGRKDDALAAYETAIKLNPAYYEARNNKAAVLRDLGRAGEALAELEIAIRLQPALADAYLNRARTLGSLGRHEDALADYRAALSLRPGDPECHKGLAVGLADFGACDEALARCDEAIALAPADPEAFNNRGVILGRMNRADDALAAFDEAIRRSPTFSEAFYNKANIHHETARLDQAVECYRQAISIKPDHASAHWNLAMTLLLRGDFGSGFQTYEWRKRLSPAIGARQFPRPPWLGRENIRGKSILVHWEQGLGDTLQFCRYIEVLEQRGARVLFLPQRGLLRLMKTLDRDCVLLPEEPAGAPFDFHCPLLSLPLALGARMDNIPVRVPYLRAEPEVVAKWRQKLGLSGFKIGVAWKGSALGTAIGKSFSASMFDGVSKIPGVRLISLQKGDSDDLDVRPDGMRLETFDDDLDAGGDAFIDTAAIIQNLDLVITTDTSVAHLAGALGRPVWVVLKFVPDWRWLLNRDDTPWYPTMRLFRQPAAGDWRGAFEEIERRVISLRSP